MAVSAHLDHRDFLWAVELQRFSLEILGLWPEIDKAAKSSSASDLRVVTSFLIIIFLSVIPLLLSLVRVWGDIILIIDNLQITLPFVIVSLKLVIMRWKQPVVLIMVKMIAEDWMDIRSDAEKDVMTKRAQVARSIVICGFSLMIFVFTVLIILPAFGLHFRYLTNFTDGNRELPLQMYYFYDIGKSPQFEIALATQALSTFLGVIIYTSVDAFFGFAICHLCGQLENFQRNLFILISKENFDCALRNNVKIHLRLIRFAYNIENTFALLMLGLVFYFAIVFCLYGVLLVSIISGNDTNNISVARRCFVFVCIIIVLSYTFLYCVAGEIIIEKCEAIYRTICDLEWYTLESRKQRSIILLMLRANKSFRITAGKIFPLTVSTFCSVRYFDISFISIVASAYKVVEKDELE